MIIYIPIRTRSVNRSEHWRTRSARRSTERKVTAAALFVADARAGGTLKGSGACRVKLTRIAPRPMDTADNLNSCMKSIRDEIALFLGVDDGHWSWEWQYAQRRGRVREYAVEVDLEPKASVPAASGVSDPRAERPGAAGDADLFGVAASPGPGRAVDAGGTSTHPGRAQAR